jgi:hypothetical protein
LLVNVAFLIGFFWLLFAIVGVQSFKSSFRRTCMYLGDNIGYVENNTVIDPAILTKVLSSSYTQNTAPSNFQPCGGYMNSTNGEEMYFPA